MYLANKMRVAVAWLKKVCTRISALNLGIDILVLVYKYIFQRRKNSSWSEMSLIQTNNYHQTDNAETLMVNTTFD